MNKQHELEVKRGERFTFGDNWASFLKLLNDDRIRMAEASLKHMLGVESLKGKTFLDAGSGSGLFSLAARRLGTKVHSFDFDPQSVACTAELKRRYFPEDPEWVVEEASVLDPAYLGRLGAFDVVYSWGVLHHTGRMWDALGNVAPLVAPAGKLFVAIYNDQGVASRAWWWTKKMYNSLPMASKWLVLGPAFIRLWGPTLLKDLFRLKPFHNWRNYSVNSVRGMDPWRDVVDWVGGYPFEVATPEQIFDFFHGQGFRLERLKTCAGGLGCNEFVFQK